MCVSGGFGGFHYLQLRRFKDITSTPLFCRRIINVSIQNPELVGNQFSQLPGRPRRNKSDNFSDLDTVDAIETWSKRG
jgi:hypothetical protein